MFISYSAKYRRFIFPPCYGRDPLKVLFILECWLLEMHSDAKDTRQAITDLNGGKQIMSKNKSFDILKYLSTRITR